MTQLIIPCETGQVSDGFHTFDELYDHRCLLFIALMKLYSSWRSRKHADGSEFSGWWIGGLELPSSIGPVTYHLPDKFWHLLDNCGSTRTLETAPEWDGHTSQDVLNRLQKWIEK